MVDNWEWMVVVLSGDWVMVIGDDDYVDLEFVLVFCKVELMLLDVEVFGWIYVSFIWLGSEGVFEINIVLDFIYYFIDLLKDWFICWVYFWVDVMIMFMYGFLIYYFVLL